MASIGEKENKRKAVSAYLIKNSKGEGRKRKNKNKKKSLSQAVGRTGRSSMGV